MPKKKIIHLFDGKNIHLNPNLIRGIWDNREERHCHVFLIAQLSGKSKSADISEYFKLKEMGCNLYFLSSWYDFYKKIISERGLIVLHGNVSPVRKQFSLLILLFLFKREALGRLVLVAWGGADFHSNKWWFPILKVILKKIKRIVTLSKVDFDNCASIYSDQAIRLDYILVQGYSRLTNGLHETSSRKKEKLRIFVSHSGWQQNNHVKSFKLIERFKNENIEVICPLAYGDDDYISKVISTGQVIFGDKFKFFTDLMPVDDYFDLLSTADIFITSADIQTGLFAVTTCLGSGCKVFCGDNLFASLSEDGFSVSYVDDLRNISFSDLRKNDFCKTLTNQSVYLNKFGNPKSLSEKWAELYDL